VRDADRTRPLLCVGGPLAGERKTILYGDRLLGEERVAFAQFNPRLATHYVEYRRQIFGTPQGDLSFWIPVGQTPMETMRLLCEAYERSPVVQKNETEALRLTAST